MDWTSITLNRQSLTAFGPEIALFLSAILALFADGFLPRFKRLGPWIGILGLLAYLYLSFELLAVDPTALFTGMIAHDQYAVFFKLIFGVVGLLTIIMVSSSSELKESSPSILASFVLALVAGLSLMAAATDILMMYLALETVSVLSYVMVGFRKHDRKSSEAGLKYILYGALSSGVMIFGFSYLYGLVGSTNLTDIGSYFSTLQGIGESTVLLFSLFCIMIGFGFKIATFPTQMWCPDVYEGAPTPVTAFLSVGPKAAGFAMLCRFLFESFHQTSDGASTILSFVNWNVALGFLAAITMFIGNLAAIAQRNLKRLMAYSSISHAGYLLMGVSVMNEAGLEAVLFYLMAYLLMNFGAFIVIMYVADRLGSETIEAYRGLGWRAPVLSGTLAVFLFSLTGLPPFMGFIGKFWLFSAVIAKGSYWLAVIAAVNTVISLVYYARVLKAMYLDTPYDASAVKFPRLATVLGLLLAVPTLIFGVYFGPLYDFVAASVDTLFL